MYFFFWNGDKSWELMKRYLKCLLFHLLRTFFFFTLQVFVEQVESEEDEKMQERNSDSESMSRRNLETIVEAIRHLEGDRLGFNERTTHLRGIPHSDESEKESSVTCSEPEDRDSPIPFEKIDSRQSVTEVQLTELHPHLSSSQYHEKFPIATNLLHRPNMVHYYCRPNVIVQKS